MHRKLSALTVLVLACSSLSACKKDDSSEYPSSSTPTSSVPTPRDVCGHLSEMIVAEIGPVDPSVQQATINECVVEMEEERQLRGEQDWANVGRCVMASNNEADIDRCDQLYPGPARDDGTREAEACLHMLEVALTEAAAAGEINIDDVSDEQLRAMNDECLAAFAADKQTLDPTEYNRIVDCVLSSTTMEQMQTCG